MLLPLIAAATPDPTPDSNAAVVRLRVNCGSSPDNENCFESMSALTTTGTTGWIWATRNPSASAPLLVDVGPGVFTDPFLCDGTNTSPQRGYVTLRGSGREQTIVRGSNFGASLKDCSALSFIDIGIQGPRYAVAWTGAQGGSSSWSNVDLLSLGTAPNAASIGWYDANCDGQTTRSVHYFHGSRIRAISGPGWNVGFFSRCAENWIFGGEISLELTDGSNSSTFLNVVQVGGGFVETFGTAIRGRVGGTFTTSLDLVGVNVFKDGLHALPVAFHSHGVNIGLSTKDATQNNINVVAISAADDVMVHSPGTAYALTPGTSATATRVRVTGGTPMVMAPFQWSADTTPPAVTTVKGEDLFVETDCSSTGCSTTGTEPHLLVSNPSCTSGWWDVGLKACR